MIEGKVENWKKTRTLRLRVAMLEGTISKDKFSVTHNIDNRAIFVEIGDYTVTYYVKDMVQDAIRLVEKERQKESSKV